MIIDSETNSLYLADCLPKKQPRFFQRFETELNYCGIPFVLLPHAKDIWAVDFMPVQVKKNKFVQFAYNPDYLQSQEGRESISNVDNICKAIGLKTQKSNLVVDGGNVSRANDKIIMCDKVFHENKGLSERELIRQLGELFEVDNVYFVPWDENDFTGHADGMVRFIDSNTVLINDYSKESKAFQRSFRMSLHNAGLDWIELPYIPSKDLLSAKGLYINYLQTKQAVIMPTFKSKYDEQAMKILEDVFKGQTITSVHGSDLAAEGGILNCVTWNIFDETFENNL